VPVLFGVRALLAAFAGPAARAIGAALTAAVVVGLALLARAHAAHYANEAAFWADAYEKRDPASRTMLTGQILSNHAAMLFQSGRADEAYALFDLAMQCDAPTYVERTHWAASLQQRGRHAEAVAALEQAIAEQPDWAESHATLGTCLLMDFDKLPGGPGDARLQRAVASLQTAVQLAPRRVASWNALGAALLRQQKLAAAEAAFARACELPYERHEPFVSRARVLRQLGRGDEAQRLLRELRAARPRDLALRSELVREAIADKDFASAIEVMREVVQIDPSDDKVQFLRSLEAAARR
jgi:Flp pilus assembly protein TadD